MKAILPIIALGGILWVVGYQLFSKISPQKLLERQISTFNIIQGNSLMPISPLYIPYTFVYGSLIGCLMQKESSGNPLAYNLKDVDGLEKFGLLQFDIPTFQEFCVRRFNLLNDIMNGEVQRICTDKMILDGYSRRWGTLYKCQ